MDNENNSFDNQNISSDSTPATNNTAGYTYGTANTGNTNNNFYAPPTPSTEPPRKKKWPIFAAVGGAVVVAGGAAATYLLLFRTPSFETPTEAITTCISQLDEQFSAKELGINTIDEKLDSEALLAAIDEKGMQMDLALTFENSSIDELSIVEGTNIGFSYANDIKNSQTSANISASFLGFGGDVGFYNDKDIIALTSDEFLPDASLSLDKTDFLDTLQGSIDEDELDAIKALFEQQSTQMVSGLTDFSDYALKQLPDSMVSFAKEWEIKENTDKDSIKIDQKDYDCFTYEVSITGEAFQGFVEDYCSYLAEYNFDKNSFFSLLQESADDMGEDVDIADTMKQGLDTLADGIDTSSDDTLDFIMYVSPKGKMLGADFDLTNSNDDSLRLELRFGGDKPGQDIYMSFEEDVNGRTLSYDLACIRAVEGDVETMDYELSLGMDSREIFAMNTTSSYDADDDTFELLTTASVYDYSDVISMDFGLEGKYDEINKGAGYELSFDRLFISIDSDDIAGSVEFSGSFSLGVCDGSVKKPSGKTYDILSLSDSDLESLLATLKKSSTLSMVLDDMTVEDLKALFEGTLGDVENGLSAYGDQNLTGLLGDEELSSLFGGSGISDSGNDTPDTTNAPDATDNPDETNAPSSSSGNSGTNDKLEAYINSDEMASVMDVYESTLDGTGISLDITGQDNILTFLFTCDNVESDPDIQKDMENAVDSQAAIFEMTAKTLAIEIGIDDLVVRIQYVDKNGTVMCQRDFTSN